MYNFIYLCEEVLIEATLFVKYSYLGKRDVTADDMKISHGISLGYF